MQRNLYGYWSLQGTLPQTGLQHHKCYQSLYIGREQGIFRLVSSAFIAAFSSCPLPCPENLIWGQEETDSQARDRLASARVLQSDEVNSILEAHKVLGLLNNVVQSRYTRTLSLLLCSYPPVRCTTVQPVDRPELIKFSWHKCSNPGRLQLMGEGPSPQPGMHYE